MKERVEQVAKYLNGLLPDDLEDVHFVCVGTDRSTGDCLGPLVGKYLKERGIQNVHGTLSDPCHALNLEEAIAKTKGKFVVAIDSSLGNASDVGSIKVRNAPLKPGTGVGKDLPEVGNIRVVGIVNVGGYMEYLVLSNTRLGVVEEMATIISNAICKVFDERNMKKTLRQVAASTV